MKKRVCSGLKIMFFFLENMFFLSVILVLPIIFKYNIGG